MRMGDNDGPQPGPFPLWVDTVVALLIVLIIGLAAWMFHR